MANPYAGEVAIVLDGQRHVAKLTLGTLAELEAALEAGSLMELVDRFETRALPRATCWRWLWRGCGAGAGKARLPICAPPRLVAGRLRRRGWRQSCWHGRSSCRARHERD